MIFYVELLDLLNTSFAMDLAFPLLMEGNAINEAMLVIFLKKSDKNNPRLLSKDHQNKNKKVAVPPHPAL